MQVRRLSYQDLPQVISIERRVFPTPWSLAMFVLELSKQSGICLAATERGADGEWRLVGYLICSRYDTVWHVMNVAVDSDHQRRGVASALLAELYGRVGETLAGTAPLGTHPEGHTLKGVPMRAQAGRQAGEHARFTLEVRRSNAVAIHLYEREGFRAAGVRRRYYQDNGEDALVMWRTPATLEGSLADIPNPGPV